MPTAAQTRAIKAEKQEQAKQNILQLMADAASVGRTDFTTKSPIARHEAPKGKVSIPFDMDLDDAERQINQERKVQNATTGVQHDFQCRREEGAVAIARILQKVFGSTGLPLRETMWGNFVPPQEAIQVGLDDFGRPVYEEVAMYNFSLPLIETEFYLDVWENEDRAEMLRVRAETKVSHKPAIEGFWVMVEDEIRRNSIYKNQTLSYRSLPDGTYKLEYVQRIPDPIFTYADETEIQLTNDVWDLIRYRAFYPADLQSTFKVLLYGALGTGKTGAVITTEALAKDNGMTVLEYSPSGLPSTLDLARCMALAKRLGPTLIAIEDYEKFSSSDLSANDRSALTNLIDGADKRDQVSIIMTTNYIYRIDESLLRGQRMTAAIEIGMLDQHGTEKLLRKKLGDQLDPDTDFEAVWKATTDFGPAFLLTCFTKALQVNIGVQARKLGIDPKELESDDLVSVSKELNAKPIGTEGLVGAARSLHGLHGAYAAVVAAKEEKKPGIREFFTAAAISWVKEYGQKIKLTSKGFSVSE